MYFNKYNQVDPYDIPEYEFCKFYGGGGCVGDYEAIIEEIPEFPHYKIVRYELSEQCIKCPMLNGGCK